jgi:hypothetical protein
LSTTELRKVVVKFKGHELKGFSDLAIVLIDNAPRQRANAFGRPIPKGVKKGGMVT